MINVVDGSVEISLPRLVGVYTHWSQELTSEARVFSDKILSKFAILM